MSGHCCTVEKEDHSSAILEAFPISLSSRRDSTSQSHTRHHLTIFQNYPHRDLDPRDIAHPANERHLPHLHPQFSLANSQYY